MYFWSESVRSEMSLAELNHKQTNTQNSKTTDNLNYAGPRFAKDFAFLEDLSSDKQTNMCFNQI
jgi:hypothetical protein